VFSQIIERWRAIIVGFVGLYSGVVKFRIRSAASHAELSLHARRRYTERLRYGGHGLAAQDALKNHCVFFRFPVYGFAFLARPFGGYDPADGRKFAPKLFFEFFEFHKKMPNQTPEPTRYARGSAGLFGAGIRSHVSMRVPQCGQWCMFEMNPAPFIEPGTLLSCEHFGQSV